jgi:AraC-like DNA-binding protein
MPETRSDSLSAMSEVPLVKVRYLQRFARALKSHGGSAAEPLARACLNPKALEILDGYIPMSQLHTFARVAATENGIWHLGLDAGISPRSKHSGFSHGLAVAPNLYRTLQTLIAQSKTEDMTATFRVVYEKGYVWLCCSRIRADAEAARQIELYRYGALLEVLRYAAGVDWLPPVLELQSRDDGRLRDVPLFRSVNVRFGQKRLAIAMPVEMLDNPLRQDDPLLDAYTPASQPAGPQSFDQAIKEVVRTHVKTGQYRLSDVAQALGMSARSLQRRLTEHGSSFSKLLEQARVEQAQRMLIDDDAPLQDISEELGYQHRTHFSRAFRRVCGLTPREFRQNSCRE